MSDIEYIETPMSCVRSSEKAALCYLDEYEEEVWIPWSVFEEGCGDIDKAGDSGVAYIAEWWLKSHGYF